MRKINLGLIGLGTIGEGVYKLLKSQRNRIKKIYNIKKRFTSLYHTHTSYSIPSYGLNPSLFSIISSAPRPIKYSPSEPSGSYAIA